MIVRTTSGDGARAVRELGQALQSGPFRVALVLSLIVHLSLLALWGWGGQERERGGARGVPLMRVRLLRQIPAPAAVSETGNQPLRPAAIPPATGAKGRE